MPLTAFRILVLTTVQGETSTEIGPRLGISPINVRGTIRVHADFLPSDKFKDFPAADVDRIMAFLGDGDDHMNVAGNVQIPVLIDGGAGDDHLTGGSFRNLLIGGTGQDRLVGGRGDDVLIGGSINHDQETLQLALAAWASDNSYEDRVPAMADLLEVIDDEEHDKLTGAAGHDLFFSGLGDNLSDAKLNGKGLEKVL
ncbi:MAG: hypothetical protein WD049_04180 [Candidatus Paceibacterota bacterium]